jgi:hypothetical protein
MFDFNPTISMVGRGENQGGTRGSLSRAGGWCREHFLSGAVALFNSVDDDVKGCHTWTVHGMCMLC